MWGFEVGVFGLIHFKSHIMINRGAEDYFRPLIGRREAFRLTLVACKMGGSISTWFGLAPKGGRNLLSGTYAYVTHLDRTIVAWPIKGHHDTFHIGLSNLAPQVLAAGEVQFHKGKLVFFDRGSGNYKPTDAVKDQAGFEPEKYRNLTYTP